MHFRLRLSAPTFCLVFGVALLTLSPFCPAQAQDTAPPKTPKWQGHITAEGKWGTDRSLAELGAFLPVWQDDNTLVFTDLRGRLDDQDSREGNFGLGLRHQVSADWIAGGYVFYDRRHTDNDNNFDQATIGAEALSTDYEFRINGYIPEATEKSAGTSNTVGAVNGANLQIQNFTAPKERALRGFDIEAGMKFDLLDDWRAWAYAGGYHFDAEGYNSVTGPRGRVELSYDDVPYLGDGARFTLGIEAQHDTVRDEQIFGIARLRVPLNYNGAQEPSTLSPLEQRMTSRIYRDIDIVSGEQNAQLATTESATATLENDTTVSSFTTIDATGDLVNDIVAAGNNSLIVVDGDAGAINVAANVRPQGGQTVIGGGGTVTVTGATTGNTATVTLPGSRPTINGTNAGSIVISMLAGNADDVRLENLTVTGGQRGLNLEGDNAVIKNLIIRDTGDDTLHIQNTPQNVLIENVSLIRPNGGAEEGIQFGDNGPGALNMTLRDVSVQNANVGFIYANTLGTDTSDGITFENVTVDNVTNVLEVQAGVTLDNPSGSITATNVGGSECANSGTISNSGLTINGNSCP